MQEQIVGVDMGGTNVRAAAIAGGEIVSRFARPLSAGGSEREVLGELFEAIDRVGPGRVGGIGCGVPSVVDVGTGVVRNPENIPAWDVVPLKHLLEQRYGVPARVDNDANCFVMGEWRYGAAAGYRNVVGVTMGTGLGVGLILDGRLFTGPNGAAGEIWEVPYRGETLEHFCSGPGLEREHGVTGDLLHRRAAQGDPTALAAFEAFGAHLSRALHIAACAYDPEIIVLGGSVATAFEFFEESMRRELIRRTQPQLMERLVITPGKLPDAALLGAAELCRVAEPPVAS